MKFLERSDFWPWVCGLVTLLAMTLGLLADGIADVFAALLLCIPPAVVVRALYRSRDREDG